MTQSNLLCKCFNGRVYIISLYYAAYLFTPAGLKNAFLFHGSIDTTDETVFTIKEQTKRQKWMDLILPNKIESKTNMCM